MLNNFIFLGQIPWTNIQVTFTDLLALLEVALCIYLIHKHRWTLGGLAHQAQLLKIYLATKKGQQLSLPM